ncbi:MAG: hypothetical protein GXY44_13545 [Phycisphaerales bacterium]|nr:hypothetical protein [Phycisphaerales bacterium]
MNRSSVKKLFFVFLCGGTLLQTTGCSEMMVSMMASLIPTLVSGLVSGMFMGV